MQGEEITRVQEQALPPQKPPKGPVRWMRDNLFSSVFNSILTVATVLLIIGFFRTALGAIFDPLVRWGSVTFNMRLYMVQAYPESHFLRVWATVGIVMFLSALSVAAWRAGGRTSVQSVARALMATGVFVTFLTVIYGGSISAARVTIGVAGLVLAGVAYLVQRTMGERAKEPNIPIVGILAVVMGLIIVLLWTLRLPVPIDQFEDGTGPIANSTRIPWTILLVATPFVYLFGKWVSERVPEGTMRGVLVTAWVASVPVIVMILLREPAIEWGEVATMDLPLMIGFGVVGTVILLWLTRPGIGEIGRIAAGVLLIVGLGSFFFPMLMAGRFLLIALALFALAAPTFGGSEQGRRRLLVAWGITVVAIVVFIRLVVSESALPLQGSFLGGLFLTFTLAIVGIGLSFPLGILLALGRTSSMPIFRVMSTVYIELIRSVPLITWLLFGAVLLRLFLPVDINLIVRVIAAISAFSAAYLAENVRGGLQSIPKGQYEAARALGMSTVQMTVFITLPQALKAVIPALVGQAIALFKDTSLVAIIGLFDFLNIGRSVIQNQSQPFNFQQTLIENLIFIAIVYWIFTYNFSRASQRLERRLGLGER